jgi:hypothetical protein
VMVVMLRHSRLPHCTDGISTQESPTGSLRVGT